MPNNIYIPGSSSGGGGATFTQLAKPTGAATDNIWRELNAAGLPVDDWIYTGTRWQNMQLEVAETRQFTGLVQTFLSSVNRVNSDGVRFFNWQYVIRCDSPAFDVSNFVTVSLRVNPVEWFLGEALLGTHVLNSWTSPTNPGLIVIALDVDNATSHLVVLSATAVETGNPVNQIWSSSLVTYRRYKTA